MLPTCYEKILPKSCCIPQRYVFAVMGFVTTAMVTLIRLSLDLTISHMTKPNATKVILHDQFSCPELNIGNRSLIAFTNTSDVQFLEWNDETKTVALGAFFQGYIWTQWVGGLAAEIFGGKRVVSYSMVTASISTILTPVIIKYFDSDGLYYLRYITGLALGMILAAIYSMMSKWIPQKEHTFIGTVIFTGTFIGQVTAMYLTSFILETTSWKAVYYVFGIFGIVWLILWHTFCYSTPNMHPYISKKEKEFLNDTVISLMRSTKYDLDPLPWMAYLLSGPVWGVTIGYIGKEWAFVTLMDQVPQLLRDVFNYDLNSSLALASSPYLCVWISALIFGFICDIVVSREYFSLLRARQVFTAFGAIGTSICLIMSTYSGCAPAISLLWMILGLIATGAFYSGVFISTLDLVPNYAGSTFGIIDNFAVSSVWLLQILKDLIVTEALLSQWRLFFGCIVLIVLVTLVVYIYFSKTDQLWWDDVRRAGYPENWSHGLFSAEALINVNGETIFKPKKDIEKSL